MHFHKVENPHMLINSAEHLNHSCEDLTAEQGHWEGRWLLSKKSFSKQLTVTHTTQTAHERGEGDPSYSLHRAKDTYNTHSTCGGRRPIIFCTWKRTHTTHIAHERGEETHRILSTGQRAHTTHTQHTREEGRPIVFSAEG